MLSFKQVYNVTFFCVNSRKNKLEALFNYFHLKQLGWRKDRNQSAHPKRTQSLQQRNRRKKLKKN